MKQKKKAGRPDGGRIFRSGVYSTAILAAAVVLAVLVNLVVQAIPVRYTEFDLSEGGLYTLGSTSAQLAGSLEQDVTIYYLCETGSEDAIITGLLGLYFIAGFSFDKRRCAPAVLFSLLGVYFSLVTLDDEHDWATLALYGFAILYLLTSSALLLYNAARPLPQEPVENDTEGSSDV